MVRRQLTQPEMDSRMIRFELIDIMEEHQVDLRSLVEKLESSPLDEDALANAEMILANIRAEMLDNLYPLIFKNVA